MRTKFKVISYAIFQFMSFLAIISLLVTGAIIASIIAGKQEGSIKSSELWSRYIRDVLLFHQEEIGILASILAYVSLGLFIGSWISGWMIFKVENRNAFDSLFLLFTCIPMVSNIFALFAQLASKEIIFASSKIDKEAIIEEQTKVLEKNRKTIEKHIKEN